MIQYYYSTKSDPKILLEDQLQAGSWVRVERPTEEEAALLIQLGIDSDVLTDALDPHEVPRIEYDDGWTYFITRVPDIGDDFNDFTTPIMFASNGKHEVTISRDMLGRLWQPFIEKAAVATGDTSTLFIMMMERVCKSYENRVAFINREMRSVTNDLGRLRPTDISTLVDYERKLNDYLDALIPTNTAIEKTLVSKKTNIS